MNKNVIVNFKSPLEGGYLYKARLHASSFGRKDSQWCVSSLIKRDQRPFILQKKKLLLSFSITRELKGCLLIDGKNRSVHDLSKGEQKNNREF